MYEDKELEDILLAKLIQYPELYYSHHNNSSKFFTTTNSKIFQHNHNPITTKISIKNGKEIKENGKNNN